MLQAGAFFLSGVDAGLMRCDVCFTYEGCHHPKPPGQQVTVWR